MHFLGRQDLQKQRQAQLLKLQKQIQGTRNEMEFVEILVQFWPLPNMARKMERLEERLRLLNSQYEHCTRLKAC